MEQARRTRKLLKSHGHLLWSFFYKHFSVVDIKKRVPTLFKRNHTYQISMKQIVLTEVFMTVALKSWLLQLATTSMVGTGVETFTLTYTSERGLFQSRSLQLTYQYEYEDQ